MIGLDMLINDGLNIVKSGQPPTMAYWITDFRSDDDLLKEWGQVCRRKFAWQRGWGDWAAVMSAKHPTAQAANSEARRLALESGYREPRWYEIWRWWETPLPPTS